MHHQKKLLLLLLGIIFLSGCSSLQQIMDDIYASSKEMDNLKQLISFSFSIAQPGVIKSRLQTSQLMSQTTTANTKPAYLQVSILKATSEEIVFNQSEFPLVPSGNAYKTKPLELEPGQYIITHYVVLDDNKEVIYATPKLESSFVDVGLLPFAFQVADQDQVITPEMIIVQPSQTPSEFGYAQFQLNPVDLMTLMIGVRLSNQPSYVTANITIEGDRIQIFKGLVADKLTHVTIRGDYANYKIIITKPDHKPEGIMLSKTELQKVTNHQALILTLNQISASTDTTPTGNTTQPANQPTANTTPSPNITPTSNTTQDDTPTENIIPSTNWQVGGTYTVGQEIFHLQTVYQCLQAHIAYSDNWSPDKQAALWQALRTIDDDTSTIDPGPNTPTPNETSPSAPTTNANTSTQTWEPNQYYKEGQKVLYNSNTYTCRQSHQAWSVDWTPENVASLWTKDQD